MTAPDLKAHPRWCVPTSSCRVAETGRHVTNARIIDEATEGAVITARMWTPGQRDDGSWITYADLAITFGRVDLPVVTLPAEQAGVLQGWLAMVSVEDYWDRRIAKRAETSGDDS